ncbi:MAG: hypothetical protein NC131_13515 [Roseburia sp.]|nr:hypothetical protein [Roseburia sp.]
MSNPKIKATDTVQDVIINISEGNPGCLTFLLDLFNKDLNNAFMHCLRFDMMGLYGSRLYQLWNDCCGRDLETVNNVLQQYDDAEILKHIDNGKGYADKFELK